MFGQIMNSTLSAPEITVEQVVDFDLGGALPLGTVSVSNSVICGNGTEKAGNSSVLSVTAAVSSGYAASDSAPTGTVSLDDTLDAASDRSVEAAAYYPDYPTWGEHHNVYAGDVYEDIELTYNARMTVHSGGTAALIYINEGSLMTVKSGGYAYGVAISSGGGLILSSGAVAEEVYWIPFEGYLEVAEGAKITYNNDITGVYYGSGTKLLSRGNTINNKSMTDIMYVGNGGTASNNTIDGGGIMYVIGGTAANTLIDKGKMDIAGGVAQGTLNSKGQLILNDGTLSETVNNATLNIYGGSADMITNEEGRMNVYGGAVTNVDVTSYGVLTLHSGANVSGINANYGSVHVSSGGNAVNTTLTEWGVMTVASGGYANVVNVDAHGSLTIAEDGESMNVRVSAYGTATVRGSANGNNVSSRGTLNVYGVAGANRLMGGTMNVNAGASAITNYVSSGGKLIVNGGSALNTSVYRNGTVSATNAYVSAISATSSGARITVNGGSTCNVTLTSSGVSMQVSGAAYLSGGTVLSSATVNINGSATVSAWDVGVKGIMSAGGGAYLRDIDVAAEGKLTVTNGMVNSMNVGSKASVVIDKGATVTNAIVSSGGSMVINGTNLNGLVVHSGAVVSAGAGAHFQFDLRNVAPGQFMVVGLDRIQGAPTYSITVSDNQTAGNYYLAVSSDLSGMSISMTIGDGSVNYGTLTMNGSELYYRDKIYSLEYSFGDSLRLVVDNYISTSETGSSDIDGNHLADIILVHSAGFAGAWLATGDDKPLKKWGNLSNVKDGVSILGTGNVYASDDNGQDVFYTDGKSVGAWTVVDGKVTGYKTIASFGSTTEILGLGDFDGDNVTDILLRSTNGAVGCYFGNGEGWNYFNSLGDEWQIAAVGDLNGDGRDDLVLRNDAGYAGTWLTQEDGKMKWANLDTLSDDTEILGTGDFNGDGVDDVLLRKGNWVGAWLVEDGSITEAIGIDSKLKHTVEQIADFDGDGIDDMRIRSDYGDLGVIYVKGEDSTKWQYWGSVGDEWTTGFSALA